LLAFGSWLLVFGQKNQNQNQESSNTGKFKIKTGRRDRRDRKAMALSRMNADKDWKSGNRVIARNKATIKDRRSTHVIDKQEIGQPKTRLAGGIR